MIGFDPTEEQRMMTSSAQKLARQIRPRIREIERARALPADLREAAHAMGLGIAALPEAIGGAGFGMVTATMLEEEIAWGDPAAPFALGGPGAFGLALAELATTEQASTCLAPLCGEGAHDRFAAVAWSEARACADRPGLATVATRDGDGFRIDGTKSYVLNADRAEAFVVFAQVDATRGWDGLGAFVISKNQAGLSIGERVTTLGLDAASFGTIKLENVRVGESDRLVGGADFSKSILRFFAKNALLVAARGTGLARAAFEATQEYVETRKAFGKPIGHFQAVAFTVADRAMDLEAARGMVQRAAAAWDAGDEKGALLQTAWAVSFAQEAAMRAADDGVQLHGGSGFMRDYPLEKLMRDAKQLAVTGMTAEQADQLAAAIELDRPLDLGLVLPTAETQSVFI